jgi:hypothetical protein
VAVDATGNVVTLQNPTAGPAGWGAPQSLNVGRLSGVTCPTADLCVASELYGGLMITTDPAAGAEAWRSGGPQGFFDSLACPSPELCVAIRSAVNGSTSILESADPASRRAKWTTTATSAPRCVGSCGYQLACPSIKLCVAVDGAGTLLSSTNPTGGRSAWLATRIAGGAPLRSLSAISCPSSSLCVVADGTRGRAFISRDPGGGATAWRAQQLGFDPDWLACPLRTLCLANQRDSFSLSSQAPLEGARSWIWNRVDRAGALTGISCPTTSACLAVDDTGHLISGLALAPPRLAGPAPAVRGRARVGALLRGSIGRWRGSGRIRYVLRWERCGVRCIPIARAGGPRLRVPVAAVGQRIRLIVTAFNAVGSTDAKSASTPPIGGRG